MTSDHNTAVKNERSIVRTTDNDLLASMQILSCIARPHRPKAGGELLEAWMWSRKIHRGEEVPDLDFFHAKSLQKNRLEPKLRTFGKDFTEALRAGMWLQSKILAEAGKRGRWFKGASKTSIRSLAAAHWNKRNSARVLRDNSFILSSEDDAGNLRKAVWGKRRPVLHMALAAGNAIIDAHLNRQEPSALHKRLVVERSEVGRELSNSGEPSKASVDHFNQLSKAIKEENDKRWKPLELEAVVFDPVWVPEALEQSESWAATMVSQGIADETTLWHFVR